MGIPHEPCTSHQNQFLFRISPLFYSKHFGIKFSQCLASCRGTVVKTALKRLFLAGFNNKYTIKNGFASMRDQKQAQEPARKKNNLSCDCQIPSLHPSGVSEQILWEIFRQNEPSSARLSPSAWAGFHSVMNVALTNGMFSIPNFIWDPGPHKEAAGMPPVLQKWIWQLPEVPGLLQGQVWCGM